MIGHYHTNWPQPTGLLQHGQSLLSVASNRDAPGTSQNGFSGGRLYAVIVHQQNVGNHLRQLIPLRRFRLPYEKQESTSEFSLLARTQEIVLRASI
jgi:hypothetical protein